jgi:hypothetical protein
LVWVWWAIQSCIYTSSGPSQSCFSSLVGGELSRLVCPPRRVDYIRILMFSRRTRLFSWRWSSKRRYLRKQNHTTRLKTSSQE